MKNRWITLLCLLLFTLTACAKKEPTLKVAATAIPHAEMLEYIKPDLAKEGITLEIVLVEDFNVPNRALVDKEVDANFFQHLPFLEAQVQAFHYPIVNFGKIHIEPLGLYCSKAKTLEDLPEKAIIAIPNDPTNEARALNLLAKHGLITLDDPHNHKATVLNIVANPKNLRFEEIDAAMLPRTFVDVDGAVINTNFALQAGLSPLKDALFLEDSSSDYANILAIREGSETRADLVALKRALTSDKIRAFILEQYQGAIIAAF